MKKISFFLFLILLTTVVFFLFFSYQQKEKIKNTVLKDSKNQQVPSPTEKIIKQKDGVPHDNGYSLKKRFPENVLRYPFYFISDKNSSPKLLSLDQNSSEFIDFTSLPFHAVFTNKIPYGDRFFYSDKSGLGVFELFNDAAFKSHVWIYDFSLFSKGVQPLFYSHQLPEGSFGVSLNQEGTKISFLLNYKTAGLFSYVVVQDCMSGSKTILDPLQFVGALRTYFTQENTLFVLSEPSDGALPLEGGERKTGRELTKIYRLDLAWASSLLSEDVFSDEITFSPSRKRGAFLESKALVLFETETSKTKKITLDTEVQNSQNKTVVFQDENNIHLLLKNTDEQLLLYSYNLLTNKKTTTSLSGEFKGMLAEGVFLTTSELLVSFTKSGSYIYEIK